jgi:hypothetical protein
MPNGVRASIRSAFGMNTAPIPRDHKLAQRISGETSNQRVEAAHNFHGQARRSMQLMLSSISIGCFRRKLPVRQPERKHPQH